MKSLKQLTEELSKSQAKTIDSIMPEGSRSPIHEHLPDMLKHEDTVFHPFDDHSDNIPIHSGVASHLAKHGYSIPSPKEYAAGYAIDSHSRMTRIGKALKETDADAEVKSSFENDPHRALAKKSNLNIAYTRNPHHVAGMSTDRGWTSCMDMNGGSNSSYIPGELHAGTHVAYLVHKSDKNINTPIARIALKPFKSDDGHVILRPESNTYGSSSSKFHDAVTDFAETHFPAHPGKTYRKDQNVYDDSGRLSESVISMHTPEHVDAAIKAVIKDPNDLSPTRNIHINDLIAGGKRLPEKSKDRKEFNETLSYHGSANKALHHQVNELMAGNTYEGIMKSGSQGSFQSLPKSTAEAFIDAGHHIGASDASKSLLEHPLISDAHRDKVFKDSFKGEVTKLHNNEFNHLSPNMTKAITKHIESNMDEGAPSVDTISFMKSIAHSPTVNHAKLKKMITHTVDNLSHPARLPRFVSSMIGNLKTNPSYTMNHAKAIDRGLIELGHTIGSDLALFSASHPSATGTDYDAYKKRTGKGFEGSTAESVMIRKHTNDAVFDHAYKASTNPANFADLALHEGVPRKSKAANEASILNKQISDREYEPALKTIDINNPIHPGAKEILTDRIEDLARSPTAIKSNLAHAFNIGANAGHETIAKHAFNNMSAEYSMHPSHIEKYKAAFPHMANEVDNKIADGSITLRKSK